MPDYEKLYRELNEDVRRIISELQYVVEKSERPIFEEIRKESTNSVRSFDYSSAFKVKKDK